MVCGTPSKSTRGRLVASLGAVHWILLIGLLVGCELPADLPPLDLADDPEAYIQNPAYRRAILERDLLSRDSDYARKRLEFYARADGWDALDFRDPASRALTQDDLDTFASGAVPSLGGAATLVPDELPQSEEAWIALGRRVFLEYPLRADGTYRALVGLEGAVWETGFLEEDDRLVGLALFESESGPAVGPTCSQCHGTHEADGTISGRLSNRAMDIGAARLLVLGYEPGDLPPELESTALEDLDRLGPGRMDVLADGEFNPYAVADFGGLVDLPYLHHNANWHHRGLATLAVRCETLFITSNNERTRVPHVLAWAMASYLRSLAPPDPLHEVEDVEAFEAGRAVFEAAECVDCHQPPLYTSDRRIDVEFIGTDPSAGLSASRRTGLYRIPSLRGVGRTAPYLHHGAFDSLDAMFDPARDEPGHAYGLDLSEGEREALIAFLERI